MRLLLDTHLLLWAAATPERLSAPAMELIENPANELLFSAASIWEIVIKSGLGREDFRVDARELRQALLANGYQELAVSALHALTLADLPTIHKDPFDRILLAQAMRDELTLMTADAALAHYPGPIIRV
ncbi:MAG: type II toxin-antitoxin system VapC family toxin [Polaromonas sp.]|nr:type II toxin-antitoxin system VapC family toxin [Polaromonas sp.]